MAIPKTITVPKYPRFLFAPDGADKELYIICTKPLALVWVRQTIPAQLFIVEGPQNEKLLYDAAEFYRQYAGENASNKN